MVKRGLFHLFLKSYQRKRRKKIGENVFLQSSEYRGAIIDASGIEILPSVLPKFYDEEGNLLFDTAELIDPENPKVQKVINFVNDLNDILKDPELSKSPLIIKIKSAINKRDFVVGKKETEKLKWLKTIFKVGKKIILTLF